jgi:hypothetical protein
MYNGLLHAHSGLRWIVLAGLIFAIFNAYKGKKSGLEFTDKDRKIGLIAFIASHIQLILGPALYFMSGKVNFCSATMSDSVLRFFTVEHTTGMIAAIALITMGYIKSKKATESNKKFSLQFSFYLIALIIILISIPWPFREALGGNWF